MKLYKLYIYGIALGFWAQGLVANAQTATDLENAVTTGSQFEQAQENTAQTRKRTETATMLEGEPGVFILKKNDIFVVGAALGTGYSDNPGRTLDTNAKDAGYASLALSAGINTRLDQQYDAGINIVASGTEYDRRDAPSYRNVIGNAYIGRPVLKGRVYLSANATAGVNTNRAFGRGTAFYAFGANASSVHKLSSTMILRPTIGITRQLSDQSEQNNTLVNVGATLIWRLQENWQATGNLAYTHKSYDNFFEDVTFVSRKDDGYRAGITVSRRINKDTDISLSLDYSNVKSTFFLSRYTALDGGLRVKISKRF